MIPGLADLPFSTGYILAGIMSCSPQAQPPVAMNFQNSPPSINNTQSTDDLQSFKKRSMSPNYGNEFPIVGGITDSSFKVDYGIDFSTTTNPVTNIACVTAKSIHVNITYIPTVYIASNYRPHSCRFTMTENHEMKHVNVDILTFREFLPYIQAEAENIARTWNGNSPVHESQIKAEQDEMLHSIGAGLKSVTDKLQEVRIARQQQVDSRDEYRYLSNLCRNEPAQ